VAFSQGTLFSASASGQDAFATGEGASAGGITSFAGGFSAIVSQAGSYMWGDSNTGGGVTATTAANQYIVRAGGGVGVNGAPKNNAIEMSIYPSRLNGPNYSNVFFGNTGDSGGILVSAGDESNATSNDAGFYLDQYDGTNQVRRMTINGKGGVSFGTNLGGFTGATATGANAFAAGDGVAANGATSFAAGEFASTTFGGSYIWGDSLSSGVGPIATTAADQYIVRATGGVGINTATGPKGTEPLGGTELTINSGEGYGHETWIDMLSASSATAANRGYSLAALPSGSFALRQITNNGGTVQRTDALVVGSNSVVTVNDSVVLNGNQLSVAGTASFLGQMEVSDSAVIDGNFYVYGNAYKPGGGSWSATSDRRIKQDIASIENAVDTLLKLRPVSFRYTQEYRAMENNLPDKPYLGFVAQEFAEVFPEAVSSTGQRVPGAPKDAAPILALDASPALITAVAAVQELAVQSRDGDERMRRLEAENAELRKRLDALATRLGAFESASGSH
jgi:hypothetical protein